MLLLLFGHYQESRIATWLGIGFLAPILVPLSLFLAFVSVGLVVVWPIMAVKYWLLRRSQRSRFQKLDRYSAEGVDGAPVKSELDQLVTLEPRVVTMAVDRFLDPRFRYRISFMNQVGTLATDQVALRADDPLAPRAWHRGLCNRYNVNRMHAGLLIRVREQVDAEELERLWKRALASPDPWVLPPELEVHEEVP